MIIFHVLLLNQPSTQRWQYLWPAVRPPDNWATGPDPACWGPTWWWPCANWMMANQTSQSRRYGTKYNIWLNKHKSWSCVIRKRHFRGHPERRAYRKLDVIRFVNRVYDDYNVQFEKLKIRYSKNRNRTAYKALTLIIVKINLDAGNSRFHRCVVRQKWR